MKSFKYLLLIASLALAATCQSQTATIPEIKGDKLGVTLEEWCTQHDRAGAADTIGKVAKGIIFTERGNGSEVCTIADERAIFRYGFKENKEARGKSALGFIDVTFKRYKFAEVAAMLERKYGKPVSDKLISVSNKELNITIPAREYAWLFEGRYLMYLISVSSADVEMASLSLYDIQLVDMFSTKKDDI